MQKKKDALIGRLRLSMSYRITLNYLKLMIINGIIFMAIFLVLYLNVQIEEYRNLAEEIVTELKQKELSDKQINPYAERGVHVMVRVQDSQEILYDDTDFTVKGFLFFKNLHIEPSDKEHKIVINETFLFEMDNKNYEAIFSYNMT